MPDWKFSEGNRQLKLDCKMGRCMKKVETNDLVQGYSNGGPRSKSGPLDGDGRTSKRT